MIRRTYRVMAVDTSTKPVTQHSSKRDRYQRLLVDICYMFTALSRSFHRRKIAVPVGLVWRVSATLYLLTEYAERTGGDEEMIRQAWSIHRSLLRIQGHRNTVHSQTITSNTTPRA